MTKKHLIIKTGNSYKSLCDKHLDFDDMIIQKLNVPINTINVVNVFQDEILPEYDEVKSIIITGSHEMVTDTTPWILHTREWLYKGKNLGIPILGICLGHQLLADAFKGKSDYNPNGLESGYRNISLTSDGKKDPLFKNLSDNFKAYVTHFQTVVTLPENAICLAYNNVENNHAIKFGENIYGVQFHPEFTKEIQQVYTKTREKEIKALGYDFDEIYMEIEESQVGNIIFSNFLNLINN
jgi:GMP synthase (glutamine-hydrolysing)